MREFLNRDGSNATGLRQQQEGAALDKSKPIEIALLPPSVVTGIPLVRLKTLENKKPTKHLMAKVPSTKQKSTTGQFGPRKSPAMMSLLADLHEKQGKYKRSESLIRH